MYRLWKVLTICWVACLFAMPAMAQEPADEVDPAEEVVVATRPPAPMMNLGPAVGAGIVMLGAGFGIARIGGQAVEGMSRQPEAAGSIQTAMIISAALIEGATFFALIVCMLFNWPPA